MILRWIGQSGYILRSGKTEIMIDPYLSDIVNEAEGMPRLVPAPLTPEQITADAVICTHDHLDHLDIGMIPRTDPALHFITTAGGKQTLAKLERCNVTALSVGQSMRVGDFDITAVFADHTVEAFGVIVRAGGKTLYFSGDSEYNEKLFAIAQYRPDAAFLCINGRLGNMNVTDAARLAEKIGARVSVPNHYGMFAQNTEDPIRFTSAVPGSRALEFGREYDLEQMITKN